MDTNARLVRLARQVMKTYALLWRKICHDPQSASYERRRCPQLLAGAIRARDLSHKFSKL